MANKQATIQIRRDSSANWISANPILLEGEIGFDINNDTIRIGDGSTAWNNLSPFVQNKDFRWKDPAADVASLPSSGNVDGDVRLVLDVLKLYTWVVGPDIWWDLSSTSSLTLDELSNVSITSPLTGDLLTYNGSGWVNQKLTRSICIVPFESNVNLSIGDGKVGFTVPASMNGMNLTAALASVYTQGTTNTTDIQIRRRRAGTPVDMLSTKITIGAEYYAADGVINTSNDDIATGDNIYIDVDAIHSVAPQGLSVTLTFNLP